ncbi:MAG: choice-of-anchor Q domain-containing protein [Bacteroidota bacterium]
MHRLLLTALLATSTLAAHAATITVNTLEAEDNQDGDCSLREAMLSADLDQAFDACTAGNGADVIEIAVTGQIELPFGFRFSTDVTLRGPGSDQLTLVDAATSQTLQVQGSTVRFEGFTIAGDGTSSVADGAFLLFAGADVTMEDVVIRDFVSGSQGGAILAESSQLTLGRCQLLRNTSTTSNGGGLYALDTNVTIEQSLFQGNTAGGNGGGLYFSNNVELVVDASTFIGNEATAGGGLFLNSGTVRVQRSTVADNRARTFGGGISTNVSALTLTSLTVTGNTADSDADGTGDGGGISGFSGVTITNSVVAGNQDLGGDVAPDLAVGDTWTVGPTNFIGDGRGAERAFSPGAPNASGQFVGTEAAPLDPLLGTLADNGGETPTRLPLATSPLLDAGTCDGNADQRGFQRPADGGGSGPIGCDIGAVEANSTLATALGQEATGTFDLHAPSPNPAAGPVDLIYELRAASESARLAVYDALGREVAVLASGPRQAGTYRAELDASRLAPGVYLVRLSDQTHHVTRPLTVVR